MCFFLRYRDALFTTQDDVWSLYLIAYARLPAHSSTLSAFLTHRPPFDQFVANVEFNASPLLETESLVESHLCCISHSFSTFTFPVPQSEDRCRDRHWPRDRHDSGHVSANLSLLTASSVIATSASVFVPVSSALSRTSCAAASHSALPTPLPCAEAATPTKLTNHKSVTPPKASSSSLCTCDRSLV